MAGKAFTGMVYPDMQPLAARDQDVRRVSLFDIPTTLRQHAYGMVDAWEVGEWYSVGEFRYAGGDGFETAVARRCLRNGRLGVEYGIELYDYEG